MTPRHVFAFAVGALLAGCSPADHDEPLSLGNTSDVCVEMVDPPDAPTLTPGWLEPSGDFHKLLDGAVLERVHGPQGGTHVDLAARVYNAESEDHIVVVDVIDGPSTRVGVEGCEGWGEAAFRVFDPGMELTLTLSLLDLDREEQATIELNLTVE